VVVILTALRLVTPQFLARHRRYALAVSLSRPRCSRPGCAVDAGRHRLADGALRSEHLVRLGCDQTPEPSREGRPGERRRARCPAAGCRRFTRRPDPEAAPSASPRPDTTARTAADSAAQGRLDTATARRLGLPTGPTRSFPASDAVIDSLLKLRGYRITQYVADTLIAQAAIPRRFTCGARRSWSAKGRKWNRTRSATTSGAVGWMRSAIPVVRSGDGHGGGINAVRYLSQARHRAQCSHQLPAGHRQVDRARRPRVDSGSTRLYGANSQVTSDENPFPITTSLPAR